MSSTRVLVTGGAGFIGSHTSKILAYNNIVPVTFDNLSTGHRDAVRWGPLIVGDIHDRQALASAIEEHRPAAVIHFAASAYVGESVVAPAKYYYNNVVGTVSLLEACRAFNVTRVVLSSSCATYGVPATLPIKEDAPQHPINPYGRSKLMTEEILRDYDNAYRFSTVILRYFNACGADPDGEIGERHDPETHLVPRALMAAAGQLPHLSVFGDDYGTSDGTCVRDYVHVSDLARAHLCSVLHLLRGGGSLTANIGTGRGISIREVLSAVHRLTGRKVPISIEPRRQGDPPVLVADPSLAKDKLGFVPELSCIDDIVLTAAPFFGIRGPARVWKRGQAPG